MSDEARSAARVWEALVMGGVGLAVGVGDYHIVGWWHGPRPLALGLGIFCGVWALVALRLRRV